LDAGPVHVFQLAAPSEDKQLPAREQDPLNRCKLTGESCCGGDGVLCALGQKPVDVEAALWPRVLRCARAGRCGKLLAALRGGARMALRVGLLMVMLMRVSISDGTGRGPKGAATRLPIGDGPSQRRQGVPGLHHVLAGQRRRSRPKLPTRSPSVTKPR
jgi:hypothetical protein